MVLSLLRFMPLAALLLGLLVFGCEPAHAGVLDGLGAALTTGAWAWLVPTLAILVLLGLGYLGHLLATYLREKTTSSQAARLVDTLSSVADGIARTLLQHPPTTATVLAAVQGAAIAQGVAYAKAKLPDTITALGMTDDTIAARLGNEVAGAMLTAGTGGASLTQAAPAIAQAVAGELVTALQANLPPTPDTNTPAA